MNCTQRKIIEMVMDNSKITQTALAETLGITTRAVKKSIKELSEEGILERVGSAGGDYWRVKNRKGEHMEDNNKESQSEIIIYRTEDGNTKIDVKFQDETVWLTQAQLCELYQTSKSNISEHIKHIFEEGELDEISVVRKFRTTGADGKNYNVTHYNLDMIISLGYRVKSFIATQFRRWATERLKEYMIKGFTMDDERLKNLGGGNYWKELLDRIRDIRSSEKVMYRQVLDPLCY